MAQYHENITKRLLENETSRQSKHNIDPPPADVAGQL